MKILALELSSDLRGAAVAETDGVQTAVLAQRTEFGARAAGALALVQSVLADARLERANVDCLVVGLGPGSYTGIRVAIALAQGWELAGKVRLLGLSSADCIAAQAREQGCRGRWQVAIDAQRGEVCLAEYDLAESGWSLTRPLRLATAAEVCSLAGAGERLIGPEAAKWCAGAAQVFPSAKHLALLAATRTDYLDADRLEPIYLRAASFVKAPPPRPLPERGERPSGTAHPS